MRHNMKTDLKDLSDMTLPELKTERDILWELIQLHSEAGVKHKLDYHGLDYWDASRRHYYICERILMYSV